MILEALDLALLCSLHYSPTDLLNQSPPDLELKESSENCLEKNIGIGFSLIKLAVKVKRNGILKHSVKYKKNKENGF